MRVFVYGSLKAGFHNNYILNRDKNRAKFIGVDYAEGLLYGARNFPMAIPSHPVNTGVGGEKLWIRGEVYEVNQPCLVALDRLEGHPHFYERCEVILKSGMKACMYFYKLPVANLKYLPDGEWKGK